MEKSSKFIYTHQGDKKHNGAYDAGPFDTFQEAELDIQEERKKGFICWGLKEVSIYYTLAQGRSRKEDK